MRVGRPFDTSFPVIARIAGFAFLSLMPLIAWLCFGTVAPYGRPHPKFPSITKLVYGRADAFDAFGQAVLSRSIVSPTAIWMKNTADYKLFGNVDTQRILSGKDGWLFFKGDFWNGECLDPGRVKRLLAQADVLSDMAGAAGIDLILSVAPDKSTIYPEMLQPRHRRYWNCKPESGALWRKLAKTEAPSLLDHAVPLLKRKAEGDPHLLYSRTDSHWTRYGAAYAFRQLLQRALPGLPMHQAPPIEVTGKRPAHPDLASRMLLLNVADQLETVKDEFAEQVRDYANTVVLRDSFYGRLGESLERVFPRVTILHLNESEAAVEALATADRVIINTVERGLFERLEFDELSDASQITLAILARNTGAASACGNFQDPLAAPMAAAASASALGDKGTQAAASSRIAVRAPEASPGEVVCLWFKIDDWERGRLELFLPKKEEHPDAFEPGRLVAYQPTESGTLAILLPDYVQGREIRVDLPKGTSLAEMKFGEGKRPVSVTHR